MAHPTLKDDPFPEVWDRPAAHNWHLRRLKGRYLNEIQLLAARAAMRSLFYLARLKPDTKRRRPSQQAKLFLATLRCYPISTAAAAVPPAELMRFSTLAHSAAADAAYSAKSAYSAAAAAASVATAYSAGADVAAYSATAAAAAYSVASVAPTFSAATSFAAAAFEQDCAIMDKVGLEALLRAPLWPIWSDDVADAFLPPVPDSHRIGTVPLEFHKEIIAFNQRMRRLGKDFEVWVEWYAGILAGETNGRYLFGLPTERALRLNVDIALIDEEFWKDPAKANAEIRRLVKVARGEATTKKPATRPTRDEIASLSTPQPRVDAKGRFDAVPHPEIDHPVVDEDLPTVPIRQIAAVERLLAGIPHNAPRHLKIALEQYRSELLARGVQPILSLLEDAAQVIRETVQTDEAGWAPAGIDTDLKKFADLHRTLLAHFPLNVEREAVYSSVPFDEQAQSPREFIAPFERVQDAIKAAHADGVATDNAVVVIEKMTEFARIIATIPPQSPVAAELAHGEPDLFVKPEDRPVPVSSKKRAAISLFGLSERTYSAVGTTTTLATTETGRSLIKELGNVAGEIWKWFSP